MNDLLGDDHSIKCMYLEPTSWGGYLLITRIGGDILKYMAIIV